MEKVGNIKLDEQDRHDIVSTPSSYDKNPTFPSKSQKEIEDIIYSQMRGKTKEALSKVTSNNLRSTRLSGLISARALKFSLFDFLGIDEAAL